MRLRLAIALAASTFVSAGVARPARAYVRGVNDYGQPVYWPGSCATVTIYLNGFTGMSADEVTAAIAAAAHAWSPSQVTCPGPTSGDGGGGHPYFEIIPVMSAGGPVPEVVNDGKNSIIFQTKSWTRGSFIAQTHHFTGPDGEIVDTDIEINATPGNLDLIWANLDPGAPPPKNGQFRTDLQTAMTHEFGHFIGLSHTCFHVGTDDFPVPDDDQGQPIPNCPDQPTCPPSEGPEAQSIMWFNVCTELTDKRVLAPDDVSGICAIYPAAQDPHVCAPNLADDGCGCTTGGAQQTPVAALSLLALAIAATRARRRRLRSDRDRRAAL